MRERVDGAPSRLQAIDAGAYETVAVVGSEKMSHPDQRRSIQALAGAADVDLLAGAPEDHSVFMDSYAERARGRIERYGWQLGGLRRASSSRTAATRSHNPGAQFRKEMTVDEVLVQPDDQRAAHAADVLADRRRRGGARA